MPRLIISTECRPLIREIIGYRYPSPTATREAVNATTGPDHAIDALRYLIFSEDRRPRSGETPREDPPRRREAPATMAGTKLGRNPLIS
jgi:hypothetical protein